jgi:hypothetical protein
MTPSSERREQFQRLALVVIVVLLAAVASDRLARMVQPAFAQDPFAFAHEVEFVHEMDFELPDHELVRIEAEVQAELAAAAQEMEAEARRMAEEAQRMAEEHRRMAGERCEVERARVRVVEVR